MIVLIFTQWRRPRILENVTQLVPVGSESQEKKVQADREQRVLCQLFFSRERLVISFECSFCVFWCLSSRLLAKNFE